MDCAPENSNDASLTKMNAISLGVQTVDQQKPGGKQQGDPKSRLMSPDYAPKGDILDMAINKAVTRLLKAKQGKKRVSKGKLVPGMVFIASSGRKKYHFKSPIASRPPAVRVQLPQLALPKPSMEFSAQSDASVTKRVGHKDTPFTPDAFNLLGYVATGFALSFIGSRIRRLEKGQL